MPFLPKRKHRQGRAQCVRQPAIPLQGAGADCPVQRGGQGRNHAGVPGTVESAEDFAHVRVVAPDRGRLAKKNSGGCRRWRTGSSLQGRTTCLSLTRCAATWGNGPTRCGRGRRCNLKVINAAGRGRSWPTSTATGARRPGAGYPRLTATAVPSVISGRPTLASFPKKAIKASARRPARPHTCNDGTIPCGKGAGAGCGKRSRSPSVQRGMTA